MAGNQLCLDYAGNDTYTTEGITKLCEGLKGSAVTSLECATTPYTVFAFVSAPVDTSQDLCLITRARSLERNNLGPEGGAALIEGLKGNSMLQVLQ